MDTTRPSLVNRHSQLFYVGDIVKFEGSDIIRTIASIHASRKTWTDADGSSAWIPNNLILVERPLNDGWNTP